MGPNARNITVESKEMLVNLISEDTSNSATLSENGSIESTILMHSRMGIRIEFNLYKNILSLWISPQAGKSISYKDRNFSCRDDHTSIFDIIRFPELRAKQFIRCDYDPFHSVLQFQKQTLHLVSLVDKPVILLWTENEEFIDLKSDKQDSIVLRTPSAYATRHPDRGKIFDFAAFLGIGKGKIMHQLEVDDGRSTFARIELAPEQLFVIGGELVKEDVLSTVKKIAAKPVLIILKENEIKIQKELQSSKVILKNKPEMQKLFDINKRHLLSIQDASGTLHASLKNICYLIGTVDGTVTSTSICQSGWKKFLRSWLEFLLANPTRQQHGPEGGFFGQLTNGKITKREEVGTFCAVYGAFMYWGLTGDERFISGKYLAVLEDSVQWLEHYCFDKKTGAIGTYYIGGGSEDPFHGSFDSGWDGTVGSFLSRNSYAPIYEGHLILRAYEFHFNLNMYNIYCMLSIITKGKKQEIYKSKAVIIEKFLMKMLNENVKAYYLLDGKGMAPVKDSFDYPEYGIYAIQNESPAFFMPEFATLFTNHLQHFIPFTNETIQNQWAYRIYGQLAGLDTEFVDESGIMQSLENTMPYNTTPSKYVPMPYTMVEVFGASEEGYHDIRTQAISAGTFQAAITNLALRTMPFGIALRGTNYITELAHFDYLNGYLDIKYSGEGPLSSITFNNNLLEHTLQIPDHWMKSGPNLVRIELSNDTENTLLLVYSTVRLYDLDNKNNKIRYYIRGYCQNVLVLKNVTGKLFVYDAHNKTIASLQKQIGPHLFVEFYGNGAFTVEINL